MEKKYLIEFRSLFRHIDRAAMAIANKDLLTAIPPYLNCHLASIEDSYENIKIQDNPSVPGLMSDLIKEIEHNLEANPDFRIDYIKDILKGFSRILPYLDIYADTENCSNKDCKAAISLLKEDSGALYYADQRSIAEKFMLKCFHLMSKFSGYPPS
jgi:hypothetical protein